MVAAVDRSPEPTRARFLAEPARPRRLTWGLLVAASVAVPLAFDRALPDAFALPKLAALYALVTLAAAGPLIAVSARLVRVRPFRWLRWPDAVAGALAGLAVLSTALSPTAAHDVLGEPAQDQGMLAWLLYVASYFLVRFALRLPAAQRRRAAVSLLVAVTVGAAIASGYAMLQGLGLDPVWSVLDKGRVFSTLGQANALAAYLALAGPCAVAVALVSAGCVRRGAEAALVVMLAALVLTYSRGGYLGVLVSFAAMAVLAARTMRPSRRLIGRALLFGGVLAMFIVTVPPIGRVTTQAWQRAASTADLQETSIQDHLDLWAVGARVALDHPILGTGPDSYALAFPVYRDTTLLASRANFLSHVRPESPHNTYLAIGSGLGLVALGAYLLLIAGALAAALRVAHRDTAERVLGLGLLGALTAHVVTDTFMTAELAGTWLFWVLLGLAVSLAPRPPRPVPADRRGMSGVEPVGPRAPAWRPFGSGGG